MREVKKEIQALSARSRSYNLVIHDLFLVDIDLYISVLLKDRKS